MSGLSSFLRTLQRRADGTGHEVAQLLNLQQKIAPLYAVLCFSAAAVAFTHRHVAPPGLTLLLPGLLIFACVARALRWLALPRHGVMARPRAIRELRRTSFAAALLSVGFVIWALALDRYGGAYEQGHVAIFVAITVLGCISCLGYHPRAAALVWLIVIGSFMTYCLTKRSEVWTAIGINIALVSAVILKVMQDGFTAFVHLEDSRRALEKEQREASRLSEQNAALAQTDVLTGLPNRRVFFAELAALIEGRAPFAIGLIDLDGFKPVNDTYGHVQGDHLLQVIAGRLAGAVGASGAAMTVARLGGDEFGVLLRQGGEQALASGQALCDMVRQPVELTAASVTVGCSMGIALAGGDAGAGELFDRADLALYHAKGQRRGGCVPFSPELEEIVRAGQKAATAFQSADLEQELDVVFQPLLDIRSGDVVAVEALARWTSPSIGAVSPEQLISTAERVGMARETTTALFRKALAGAQRLPAEVRLTFNLSALDLADDITVTALMAELRASGFAPQRLAFELTEHSVITDLETVRRSLDRLKSTGALLALDDFGTGYSSLSLLHELPFDVVKIDRSFAAQLGDATGRRLVEAIRGLAEMMSLACVIEGIETRQQLADARAAGFSFAQGYHLARPGTIAAVLELRASRRRDAA